jgi:hypothetical protein
MSNENQRPDGDFVERAAQSAHETIDQLQASAAAMGEQLADKAEALGDLEYQMVEKVRDCVRDHPLTSVLAAVVVGVVLVRLMQPADTRR